nr:MAG TPA: hypothetical protein [Bacteriophage sp.]
MSSRLTSEPARPRQPASGIPTKATSAVTSTLRLMRTP